MQLIWDKNIPTEYNGRIIMGLSPVKIDEIEAIFNGNTE